MDYNTQDLSGIPADDAMVQLELKRKLAMADALRNQEAPQGQMVSGRYVAPSWTQQLAGLANKYVAGKTEQDAMKQYGQAQQSKQAKLANALSDLARGKETVTTDNTPYQIQVPNGQTPPTDNLGGMQPYNNGMKSIDVPNTTKTSTFSPYSEQEYMAKIGSVMPDMLPKMLETQFAKKSQQDALQAQREYDTLIHRRDRGEKLSDTENANLFALDKMRQEQGFQLGKMGMEQNFTSSQNALNRNNTNANQPLVAVLDANGQPTYVPRNQAAGMMPYNAKQPITTQQSKVNDARDVISILNDAEPLIKKATSSGIGNAYDISQRFLGGSNAGAEAAAQLKALEGMLVSKMPKMSGPQSDKDVLLYKQMAGQIGDPTIPSPQKKAAMDTIRKINERYVNNSQPVNVNQQPQMNTKVINGVTYVNDGQGWHPQ